MFLGSIERVKDFVSHVTPFDADMDLVCGRYVVDAKSILGIFSMDLSKPLELQIHAEREEAEKIWHRWSRIQNKHGQNIS